MLLRHTRVYGFQGRTSCPRLSLPPGRDALQTINPGVPEQHQNDSSMTVDPAKKADLRLDDGNFDMMTKYFQHKASFMKQSFFVGVDGGATKCIVRLEDETGKLLGREISGPANIRISVMQAYESIHSALTNILLTLHIDRDDPNYAWHAGMGLAGCELTSAYQAFLRQAQSFTTLAVTSDAHTACLGAHAGHDGAIIIIGTGVVGFQLEEGQTAKVGGWGFPQDDEGGGAWLGLQAVKVTLQMLDGRGKPCELADLVYEHFGKDMQHFTAWTNRANSTAFAELAPFVIQSAQAGDSVAIAIMQEAARAINRVSEALYASQINKNYRLPCSLVGGIAPYLEPYLSSALRARLVPCKLTPDAGAVLLVRDRKDI